MLRFGEAIHEVVLPLRKEIFSSGGERRKGMFRRHCRAAEEYGMSPAREKESGARSPHFAARLDNSAGPFS